MWHPLTLISLMIDAQIGGRSAKVFHLTNLWLHVLNTALLYKLSQKFCLNHWRSALVAALFALHPCHVEAVAWVAERKGLLSTTFVLLAAIFYLRYVRQGNRSQYWLMLGFAVLASLSKPIMVALPVILLFLDYWPLRRIVFPGAKPTIHVLATLLRTRMVREKIPLFVVAAACGLISLSTQRIATELSWSYRIGSCVVAFPSYLRKLVFPHDLSIMYVRPEWLDPSAVILSLAILIGISLLAVGLKGRLPVCFVTWHAFLLLLLPVSGLVPYGPHYIADRYTYLGFIPLFFLFACVLDLARTARLAFCFRSFAVVFLIFCALGSHQYLSAWVSTKTLFARALESNPANYVASAHLALCSLQDVLEGRSATPSDSIAEASKFADASLQARPTDFVYILRGYLAELAGKPEDAKLYYQAAIESFPSGAAAHFSLARLLAWCPGGESKEFGTAVHHAERACQLIGIEHPAYPEYLDVLACAHARKGDFWKALEILSQVQRMSSSQSSQRLFGLMEEQRRCFVRGETWTRELTFRVVEQEFEKFRETKVKIH